MRNLIMVVVLCAVAACAGDGQTLTQQQRVATVCAQASASYHILAAAILDNRISKPAHLRAIRDAMKLVRPVCSAYVPPTMDGAQTSALEAAANVLHAYAMEVQRNGAE